MIKLETGDTGAMVTAGSDGALYSGIFGLDNYVISTGSKFKAEIQSNNKIKINDGSAVMNGRHIRIPFGDSEMVTINNGSQGMNRIDLIVIRYEKALTGIEKGSLVVIQGEETTSVPSVPDHIRGNILMDATQADYPLYEVRLEGINIVEIKQLFQTIGNITMLEEKVAELNSNLKKNYVQGGIANTSSLNGYFRSVHITFPTRYKATPNVVATVMNYQNSVIDARLCTLVKNMSTTGADIYVADQSGEIGGMGYQVQWIAVGEID